MIKVSLRKKKVLRRVIIGAHIMKKIFDGPLSSKLEKMDSNIGVMEDK